MLTDSLNTIFDRLELVVAGSVGVVHLNSIQYGMKNVIFGVQCRSPVLHTSMSVAGKYFWAEV